MNTIDLKEIYWRPDTLNIFCDASLTSLDGQEVIVCPGYVAIANNPDSLYNQTKIDQGLGLLRRSTNNRGELTAILWSIMCADKYRNMFKTINIFSDSKISVMGLREWIYGWYWSLDDNNNMYSSSGQMVANLDIIKQIILYVSSTGIRFNLFHVKGHITNHKGLEVARNTFLASNNGKENNVIIDDDLIMNISKYNDMIDVITGEYLETMAPQTVPMMELVRPISNTITRRDISRFCNNIRNHNTKFNGD